MVTNAEIILTKQLIIQKVYELFADCVPMIKNNFLNETALPAEIIGSVPKISKGENYLQLPYVMLDYPRTFGNENTFAIRTMFWWANFFSITLHVSGSYKMTLKDIILKNSEVLSDGFYISIGKDEWAHHFNEDNYQLYTQLAVKDQESSLDTNNFLKLALKFDLQQWNKMEELLNGGYRKIAALLTT